MKTYTVTVTALAIVELDDRWLVEYNGCVVYAAYSVTEALKWADAHSKDYQ